MTSRILVVLAIRIVTLLLGHRYVGAELRQHDVDPLVTLLRPVVGGHPVGIIDCREQLGLHLVQVTQHLGVPMHRGDVGEELYLIKEGLFEVINDDDTIHRMLGTGSYFGEIALLCNVHRTMSVRATPAAHVAGAPVLAHHVT